MSNLKKFNTITLFLSLLSLLFSCQGSEKISLGIHQFKTIPQKKEEIYRINFIEVDETIELSQYPKKPIAIENPSINIAPIEEDETPYFSIDLLSLTNLSQNSAKASLTHYRNAKYTMVLQEAYKEASYDALYFAGMAYYQLILMPEKYSINERLDFYDKNQKILELVATNHNDDERKALAIFWLSKVKYFYSKTWVQKQEAIDSLKRITVNTNLKQTKRYNDAIYLKAQIFQSNPDTPRYIIDQFIEEIELALDPYIWDTTQKVLLKKEEAIYLLSPTNLASF